MWPAKAGAAAFRGGALARLVCEQVAPAGVTWEDLGVGRPSGTVTFLFTDVEGSTRLWDEHPDAMASALARHDEIVRRAVDEQGGYMFSTGGDGFAAAFARSIEAVAA